MTGTVENSISVLGAPPDPGGTAGWQVCVVWGLGQGVPVWRDTRFPEAHPESPAMPVPLEALLSEQLPDTFRAVCRGQKPAELSLPETCWWPGILPGAQAPHDLTFSPDLALTRGHFFSGGRIFLVPLHLAKTLYSSPEVPRGPGLWKMKP